MRRPVLATALSLALVLAACGGTDGAVGDLLGGDGAGGGTYACGGTTFDEVDPGVLPGLEVLSDQVLAAVDDAAEPVVDTSLDWRVVRHEDDEVVLLRALDPSSPEAASGDTHAFLELGPIDGAPNIPDGSWFSWASGLCTLRLADGGVGAGDGQAELRLADTPSPSDTELPLLVMERRCASGQSAEGRIVVDDVELTDTEVRLRISVSPPPGDAQECPGNPWTPFALDLGEPLGDRTIVDAYLVPARELVVGTDDDGFDPSAEDRDAAIERALSFDVWRDYTTVVETSCYCSGGVFEVVVRDGAVVARRILEANGGPPLEGDPDPLVAPSLGEALERLGEAWATAPDTIVELTVAEDGLLVGVSFDPLPGAADDEIAFAFTVDVDSPGDPVG